MTYFAFTRLVPFCCCVLLGCASQNLVGEDRCYGVETVCGADAPRLDSLNAPKHHVFDLVSSRTLAPSWTLRLPCEDTCRVQLAPGHEGSVWASTAMLEGSAMLQVSADGQITQTYPSEPWGTLSVDAQGQPRLTQWYYGYEARIVHFGADGARSVRTFEGTADVSSAVRVIAASVQGKYYLGRFGQNEAYVEQYAADGTLEWRQSQLREARRYPFENLGPGIAPLVSYDLLPLANGSLLVVLPKYLGDDEGEHAVLMRQHGFSLLDESGNLRWDAALGGQVSTLAMDRLFARDNGDLVTMISRQDLVSIIAFDQSASVIGQWAGQRVDFHAAAPLAACLDNAGTFYFVVRGGARDAATMVMCKLDSADPSVSPECAELDLPGELLSEGNTPAAAGQGAPVLACPAPGRVVLSGKVFRENIASPTSSDLLVAFEF